MRRCLLAFVSCAASITIASAQPAAPQTSPVPDTEETTTKRPPPEPEIPEPAAAPVPPPSPPPPPPARTGVMLRRWSVALALGSETLRTKLADAPRVTFGTLELSGRFRIRPSMEVALGLGGGGAARGDLSTGGLYADFRYRFRPERPLDVYAQIGLGTISVARKDAGDVEKQGRGSLRFGGGVEWRFTPLIGVAFELRFVGVGENTKVPVPIAPSLDYEMARYDLSGVALALSSSFYF